MQTIEILKKKISYSSNVRSKAYQYITLFEALNSIRLGKYQTQVEDLRRVYKLGKNAIPGYRKRKKQLPVFLFSGIFSGRGFKFDLSIYTSLIVLDIDKVDEIEKTRELLKNDPHIIAVWLSPSGNGLKALSYIEYDRDINVTDAWIFHEYLAFPHISKYLSKKYELKIDKTGKDITRRCFVSHDPYIHLKSEFEPFRIDITISNTRIHKLRFRYNYSNRNVIEARKEQKEISRLIKESKEEIM